MFTINHPWVFAVGLIGNVVSFMVFLAPLPTFIRIYKKKSTEGFESLPYVVAVFSAMLWIYYALLKGNTVLLITINVAGVIIESIYIAIYVHYAPKQAKMSTLKLLLFLNIGVFAAIVLVCNYLVKVEAVRLQVFGWICVAISIAVFAAPLSVMRLVIRTKSVEFMPFNLSFCLTLTATIWFFYGMLQKDFYITLPNIVGFVFGVAQMILYAIFSRYDKAAQKQKLPEQLKCPSSPVKESTVDLSPIDCQPKTQDTVPPNEAQEAEIEIVVGPLPSPTSCKMDADKIVGGPSPVPLVQCAV